MNSASTETTAVGGLSSEEYVHQQLDEKGIVRLDGLIPADALVNMQQAFESRLRRLRWNNLDGYEKTERHRHMVQDVLTLDQGFVDVALHPLAMSVMSRYLGESFVLAEAKGWRSLPTKRDFHGWHGDAWYDQETIEEIPREVKLAFYLTDVRSGFFQYIQGSHRQQAPRDVSKDEIDEAQLSHVVEMSGPAGTAFLFDTSGIHRQAMPILEPRNAVFLNYHDPTVTIQRESVKSYRYHPLILNAAFLGGLSVDDQRVLGFGDKQQLQTAFTAPDTWKRSRRAYQWLHECNLVVGDFGRRVVNRLRRLVS